MEQKIPQSKKVDELTDFLCKKEGKGFHAKQPTELFTFMFHFPSSRKFVQL